MKKIKYLIIVLLGVMIIPFNVKAHDGHEPINIFFFHGDGCGYCAQATEFLNGLDPEYQSMFNMVRFEVWGSETNENLMMKVADKLGVEVDGVPFYVIGKETFNGYGEEYNQGILNAIETEFASEERFLDIEKLIAEDKEAVADPNSNGLMGTPTEDKTSSSDIIVIIVSILIIAGFTTFIVISRKKA